MRAVDQRPEYHAYVLRFWADRGAAGAPATRWRFSLEDPRTSQRRGFADLPGLVAFLRAATVGVEGGVLPVAGDAGDAGSVDGSAAGGGG